MKKYIIFLFLFLQVWIVKSQSFPALSTDFESSGWCQDNMNVNSTITPPALDNFKRAVVKIIIPKTNGDWGTCTGTIVNQNVNQNNLKQILLFAKHCVDHDKTADYSKPWYFQFNYQSPNTSNSSVPLDNQNAERYTHISMVRLIDISSVTDFAAIEIMNPIPPHFNIYYAGWSVSYLQGLELPYYSIHHPRGDIKKIAKTHTATTVTNYPCHIVTEVIDVVYWALFGWWTGTKINTRTVCTVMESPYYLVPFWTNGLVQKGSSGSALINANARLIGTLSGGASECGLNLADYYGRMNSAWVLMEPMREQLNPGGVVTFGEIGRQIDCFSDLNLNGLYYPAIDYQSINKIVLKSGSNIIGGNGDFFYYTSRYVTLKGQTFNSPRYLSGLTIYANSHYVFQAANQIDLVGDVEIEQGADFEAKIAPCSAPARLAQEIYPRFYDNLDDFQPVSEVSFNYDFYVYPNPVVDNSTINFTLPSGGESVSMKLYDGMMNEKTVVFEGNLTAGEHSLQLNIADFGTEDIIYCKLTSNNFSSTIRLTRP
jgi:hypothetical protein